ncbi:cache domain-containing sensor histidine kinase [Paenibacillus silviterrae]|uniref:cache domain-containing sensor histidine kinase n=1 Tax=Paenibacillus silviterrae TaxID=3242194 RepID=UPI0025439CEE|nr:sensor histidine kinase [Paenibacillus chinjuensis]
MLKTKMFLSFSMVSLFIVGITCGMFYIKYTRDIMHQASSLSSIISRQFSEMVDLYMQNIEELSLSVSISPAVQSALMDYKRAGDSFEKELIGYRLSPFLFDFSYPKPYVQGISIHTLDGYLYYYVKMVEKHPAAPYPQEKLQTLVEELESKRFILQTSVSGEGIGEPAKRIVSFHRRIHRIPTQQAIGVATIHINVNAFKALARPNLQSDELGSQMTMLLLDEQGEIIYENGSAGWEGSRPMFPMDSLEPGKSAGELVWRSKAYFYTYEASDYTGWHTVSLIPKTIVLHKQQNIRNLIVAAGLVTMLLVALVSYTLSYQITLPLRNMMRKMSSVELGNFNQRMEYTGRNEIGKLSRMYNHMLDSISRLIHEVYESKLAEKNAQLAALHAQINPHFLFNTLNIMKSISRLRGIEEVAEICVSLAGLFQYSMKQLDRPVMLLEELAHLQHYFKIQQHRFGDRLELEYRIPDSLLKARLLKLTLQPLVENAVNHGLKRRKSGGRVHIQAEVREGMLLLTVSDNGDGVEPERLTVLQRSLGTTHALQGLERESSGVGLLNIHQRIQLFYGREYGACIESNPGSGTTVTLRMPLSFAEQEEEAEESYEHLSG